MNLVVLTGILFGATLLPLLARLLYVWRPAGAPFRVRIHLDGRELDLSDLDADQARALTSKLSSEPGRPPDLSPHEAPSCP